MAALANFLTAEPGGTHEAIVTYLIVYLLRNTGVIHLIRAVGSLRAVAVNILAIVRRDRVVVGHAIVTKVTRISNVALLTAALLIIIADGAGTQPIFAHVPDPRNVSRLIAWLLSLIDTVLTRLFAAEGGQVAIDCLPHALAQVSLFGPLALALTEISCALVGGGRHRSDAAAIATISLDG